MTTTRKITTLRKPNGAKITIRARKDTKNSGKRIFLLIGREPYIIRHHEIEELTNNLVDLMEEITNAKK
ncbi:hypothetical protein [Corynebacterium sp. LK33]|uniref:hypothetical protein n=1 Tax=Corynebacterium sp. LK33 TaxID=2044574 RepID=UPI0016520A0D|nr:hypothetical protein [Corynebacterium sp. LK33]MBC6821455.1 hypothetical protein [Corynebacterium sp. LK33]